MKVRAGPAGIHAFDRVTGAHLLVDEARVPPTLWSEAPRSISVALTNACDLRCPYCYAPKDAGNLDTGRLVAWLDELDRHGCLGIGFGGGEPTLCRDLPELCRHAAQNTEMAVTFTTHGHRLDDHLAAELSGNVHFIRVSMDGVGTTYEALRGRCFADLSERLATVRQLAPFGINFVVNALTLPDLDAAVTFAANQGATEFLLLPEQPVRGQGGIDSGTAHALKRLGELIRRADPARRKRSRVSRTADMRSVGDGRWTSCLCAHLTLQAGSSTRRTMSPASP